MLRKNLSLQRGGQGSPPPPPRSFSRPGNTEVPAEKEPSCPLGALTGQRDESGLHPHRFRSTTYQQDLSHLSMHSLRNQEVFAYPRPVLCSEFHRSLRTLIITPIFSDGFYFSLLLLLSHSATNVQLHIKSACLQVVLWLPPLTYPFNKKGSLALPAFRPILLAPARTSHPSGRGGGEGGWSTCRCPWSRRLWGRQPPRAAQVISFPSVMPSHQKAPSRLAGRHSGELMARPHSLPWASIVLGGLHCHAMPCSEQNSQIPETGFLPTLGSQQLKVEKLLISCCPSRHFVESGRSPVRGRFHPK